MVGSRSASIRVDSPLDWPLLTGHVLEAGILCRGHAMVGPRDVLLGQHNVLEDP